MNRRAFLAAVGVAVTGVAGCTGSGATEREGDVGMGAADFRPELLEVAVGETVLWENTGSRMHTVTAYEEAIPDDAAYFASGGYDSESAARDEWFGGFGGAVHSGETYEHTFEVPGEYTYYCIPHEAGGMVGKVVVTE